jgi:hypothetical protein
LGINKILREVACRLDEQLIGVAYWHFGRYPKPNSL